MYLNARQQEAVLLPFQRRLGLIEGPPGTGKTHVLACMLIALMLEAWHRGPPPASGRQCLDAPGD